MSQIADIAAERALVGACLLSPEVVPDVMGRIGQEEFFFPPYRLIYSAIADLSLDQQPVTPATVSARLSSQRIGYQRALEVVGGSAIVVGSLEGADVQEWSFWAARVRRLNRLRNLNKVAEEALELANSEPDDVDAAYAKVEESLAKAAFNVASEAGSRVGSDALLDRIEKYVNDPDGITGMETGWGVFDRELDGLEPGNTTIVYAPSSHFKSMFVQNIGYRLAKRGHPGIWFTTEMPHVQVEERLLQLDTGLNLRYLRRNHGVYPHRKTLVAAAKSLSTLPITIIDKTSLDIGRIRAEVVRHQRWGGIQYAIVDLVDHVVSRRYRDNETANEAAVMIAMKDIAKSCNVHILMTKHIVKRQKAERVRASYDPEDMRGSGAYGQDVDTAISLSIFDWDEQGRPVGLTKEQINQRKSDNGRLNLMAWIAKNRPGDTGPMEFVVNLRNGGRIDPMSPIDWVQGGMKL